MAYNYYQNPYMNNSPYMNYQLPQSNYQIQSNYQTQPTLYGKLVDSYETAKGQEVPIGTSGIYPNANGTAIYTKQWCPDGTTKTCEYRLYESSNQNEDNSITDRINDIYNSITELNKKIDKLDFKSPTIAMKRKKVGDENE